MTYLEVKNLFKGNLPDYFENYFEEFINQYDPKEKILKDEELEILKKEVNINDLYINTLNDINNKLINFKDAHLAISFFVFVSIYKINPWENLYHDEKVCLIDGYDYGAINFFIVSKQLAKSLIYLNPPKSLNIENINAYLGYSNNYLEENHVLGISPFHWNMQCAGGCMFMFNTLKFCPSFFTGDFPVITNKKNEYITLTGDKWFIDKNHHLTNNEIDSIGKTSFYEDENCYIANVINKDGTVSLNAKTFKKSEWFDYLRDHTDTIDIHIPSNKPYEVEEMIKSYKEALAFYKKYYPNHQIKAIVGYSWLFAPELKNVLKEDSNILKVQKSMHLIPTLGTYDETCEFIKKGSKLQERIKENIKNGGTFHYGIMYIPITEFIKEVE